MVEQSADEDVLAIDCTVQFAEADVRVQVKCTSQVAIRSTKPISWPVTAKWIEKWERYQNPVYLLTVVVNPSIDTWLLHQPGGTFHNAAAFWVRVNFPLLSGLTVQVPRAQRLTRATLAHWRKEATAPFEPVGVPS